MKTIFIIDKEVYCFNLSKRARGKLERDLTFENPAYRDAMKAGRYIPVSMSPHLEFFVYDEEDDAYLIPRGYLFYIWRWIINNEPDTKVEVEDESLTLPEIDFKFQGKLRDYQEQAVADVTKRWATGTLEASTGAGKTVMALGIIAERKQPTLIIVHNKELLYQWQGAIKKFLGFDCGIVGDSKFDVKDITVGIVNTVRNKKDQLKDLFGHVICDEVHRCPSTMWMESLAVFPAKFILGLSATPFRRDGLGNAIYIFVGPKTHKVDKKMLRDTGAVLKPNIIRVETNFNFMFRDNYSTMISELCKNPARNEHIARIVQQDISKYHKNVLIVSDRVSHCKLIGDELYNLGIPCRILHGKVPPKKREEIVRDIKAGVCQVLIATISLIGEGFDAPNLSALFLSTPVKFSGRVIQTVGRVLRPEKGKTPRVYDFRDNKVGVLKYSGFNRDKIYRKEWG